MICLRPRTGLLPAAADPLAAVMDSELRGELMRCGHFAAACPDAFQGDVSSLRLGTCIYPWTQLAIGQQDPEMNKVQTPCKRLVDLCSYRYTIERT